MHALLNGTVKAGYRGDSGQGRPRLSGSLLLVSEPGRWLSRRQLYHRPLMRFVILSETAEETKELICKNPVILSEPAELLRACFGQL